MSFTLQDYENQDAARASVLTKAKNLLSDTPTVDDIGWCAGAIEQVKYRCEHLALYAEAVNLLATAISNATVLTGEQARVVARSTVFTDIPNGQEERWAAQYSDTFDDKANVVCGMRTCESFGDLVF